MNEQRLACNEGVDRRGLSQPRPSFLLFDAEGMDRDITARDIIERDIIERDIIARDIIARDISA